MQVLVSGGGVGEPIGKTSRWLHAASQFDAIVSQRYIFGISARQLWQAQQTQNIRYE